MGFLHPWFLLLGLGIIIPIAVHLFNFHRFKQVLFTNVKFLQSIATESKKQNKLLERLLLLMRCLTVLFLALLFAQPYIKNQENKLVNEGNNAVVIVLDNSFSMQNVTSDGTLLASAKAKAQEIVNEYSDNDVFCLLTSDLEGKHKHFVSKQTFLNLLKEAEISPSTSTCSELVNTAHRLLSLRNENSKRVFIISDFQKSFTDIQRIKQDSLIREVFLPLEVNNINNVYVDSVLIDKNIFLKGQTVDLTVRIKNASDEPAEKQTVKLYINGLQQSLATCDIPANSSFEIPMGFVIENAGRINARINILDNPVTYDDDFYFTINVGEKIKVLSINGKGENTYLNRLFKNSSEAELVNMNENNINFSEFASYSVIILNELKEISSGLTNELKNLREKGVCLVVIPGENIDIASYNNAMQTLQMPLYSNVVNKPSKVAKTDTDNRIFRNVFTSVTENMEMPSCKKYYKITYGGSTSVQNIMTMNNNDAFLSENTVNTSNAFIFTVPLNDAWSDFVNQSVFVPLMWNIVLYSSVLPPASIFTDSKELIDISVLTDKDRQEYVSLVKQGSQNSIIPQMQSLRGKYGFYLHNKIKQAGFYDIKSGENIIGTLALNYPRTESDLTFFNSADINKLLKNSSYKNFSVFNDRKMIKTYFNQSQRGFDFTFLLLALIVICLIGESFIIYKLKK